MSKSKGIGRGNYIRTSNVIPGPKPSCSCGKCKLCRNRVNNNVYYRRHTELVLDRKAKWREAQRRRRLKLAASNVVTDEDLDRRMGEYLKKHGIGKQKRNI